MALTPGTRLGVYDVLAAIGEGGMGQVWRARDTRLNRDVALKCLPDSFANDAERLARFTREAQTLASLNHPHIAAIYGLEESNGVRALVMELVEGDDLSQRIARGAIPLDDALPIARQIAEALEAAHEQGIIHRDLKPANIKVRPDGTVKVLDFGLAKALDPAAASSSAAMSSPTITSPAMTQAGMILGTAAYMSPEQASGKAVDKRADVWSFGVVLLEMLTGQRLFDGETVAHTLADVLRGPLDFSKLPADTPTAIRDLLRRCLTRDVKKRTRDIGDARIAIDEIMTSAADGAVAGVAEAGRSVAPPVSSRRQMLPWAVAATLGAGLVAVLGLWAPWRARSPLDRPLLRLDVDLGADVSLPASSGSLRGGGASSVAISPDGGRLAYVSGTPEKLFIRRLDQATAIELPGTQGASTPVFSPDGQWVAFLSGDKAYKISMEGGAVVPLGGDGGISQRATWGDDGSILRGGRQLTRLPPDGSPPEIVAEIRTGELSLVDPQMLPGGNAILFATDNPGPVDKTNIEVVTLADRQRRVLVQGGASPQYAATSDGAGHLLYVNGATLFAIPFDVATLTTRGAAVPLVDDVAHADTIGSAQFDVSRTGTLVYRRAVGGVAALRMLQWVDAAGKRVPLLAKPAVYQELALSPDGTRIAVSVADGRRQDVWVYDVQRDATTRLTFGDAIYRYPTWSPDGRAIALSAVGTGLQVVRVDGAGKVQALTETRAVQYPSSFSPDGRQLAFFELTPQGNRQLWTLPLVDRGGQLTAGTPEPFLKSSTTEIAPSISLDGRWLAYESDESGSVEVYVRTFPASASGRGSKWLISNNGGRLPRWSTNGRNLVYQSGDQLLTVAYAVQGDAFVAEKPRVWIPKLGVVAAGTVLWDLAPDGKRVLVVSPVEGADGSKAEHHVVFLQNFFDELRRKVPLGK